MLNVYKALLLIIRPRGRVVDVASHLGRLNILQSHLQKKFSSDTLTEEVITLMKKFIQDVKENRYGEEGWPTPFRGYGTSKIGEIALTKVFARQMVNCGKEDILVNACCPGWVRTDMSSFTGPLSPDEGAETPVFCAFLPRGGSTGQFFKNKVVIEW